MSRVTQSFSKDPVQILFPQNQSSFTFSMTTSRPTFVPPFPNNKIQYASNISPRLKSCSMGGIPLSSGGRKRSRTATEEEDISIQLINPHTIRPELWNKSEIQDKSIERSRPRFIEEIDCKSINLTPKKDELENAAQSESNLPNSSILGSTKSRGAKSLRLDTNTSTPTLNTTLDNSRDPSTPSLGHGRELHADKITSELGIGWSLITDTNPDIQSAVRGWGKFIENHFPITNVKIRIQSKGLASFLVEASEGYFLFGDNLKHGRLVSVDSEKVCINLQGSVPIFDGDVIMEASRTPNSLVESFPITSITPCESNKAVVFPSSGSKVLGANGSHDVNVLEVNMDIC